MTEPMPEPTDQIRRLQDELRAAVSGARQNAMERDGAQEDVDRLQAAGIVADRAHAADVARLREELRQQELRQQELRQQELRQKLAEREATDLREQHATATREVGNLRGLLDSARRVLDVCAEDHAGQNAATVAQRIVDWIGHSVTDEPATAAELQAEVYRLQHLLYGDAGPDASDPDDGDACADVRTDGDPIPAACHVEHQGAFCRARAHIHCAGTGTCAVDGAPVPCSCACHGAVIGATL